MKIYDYYNKIDPIVKGAVVVIGNFDGLHNGHKRLLDIAKQKAVDLKTELVVMSFEPHPRQIFSQKAQNFRLSDKKIKINYFSEQNINHVILQKFDEDFANLSAQDFIDTVIKKHLDTKLIVVGKDFRYGSARKGDLELLKQNDIAYFAIDKIECAGGLEFSSSRIRELLRQGRVDEVAPILGHNWITRSIVEHGDQRGREIGYPTANCQMGAFINPKQGVYALCVKIEGEEIWRNAVANFGLRPTYELKIPQLEIHIIDYDGDLYGKELLIEWVKFIREEKKFTDVDDLLRNIALDEIKAKSILTK